MNLIKAVFGGGRFATTAPVFQWDYGDRLQFIGISLPQNYEVHFANSLTGVSVTALGAENGVEIPASVFQPGSEIYAWVFLTEEGAGWTKYQARIPIYKRAQPTNETPTPAQQSALDSAIALLNEAAEDLSEAEQGIPTAIDTALQEAKDSGEFDGAPGADGQDGYSPTVTVTEITGGHEVTITDAEGDHVFDVMDGTGGGGGTGDYSDLTNKPQINGYTLSGNKTAADLGLANASDIPEIDSVFNLQSENPVQNKVLAAALQAANTELAGKQAKDVGSNNAGKFLKVGSDGILTPDNLPSAPVTSVNSQTGAVSLSASDVGALPDSTTYVSSVNGSTGAVTLSIPSSAGDVGAIPAPASPSADDVLTYSNGAWAAAAPAHELPAGGNSGAVLAKNGSTDYSVYWRSISDYTAAGIVITAAATAAKVCQYSFWDDTHYPQILYITLASANTAASALTLKVNGKGPYPVYINGAASSATNYTLPAGAYAVYFDGTNFYFQTDGKIPEAATDPQEVTVSTAGAVTQALDAGKIYHFTGALTSLTITLNAAGAGIIPQYHFDFDSGSTAPTVTLPGTVTMQGGTFSAEASKHYEIDILNNYGVCAAW